MNIIKDLIDWILQIIEKYGLLGVFVGSILEEIVAPIPSPVVMMAAGAGLLGTYEGFSIALALNLLLIALVGSTGATIGSYFMYGIGYFGGKPFVEKTSRFTGVSWKEVEKLQNKLSKSKSDELTIAGLRSIPVMPSVIIAVSCGVLRINPISYTLSFFSGGILRNIIFLTIGWQVGAAYAQSAEGFENVTDWVTKLIALCLVLGVGYLYWRRHKAEKAEQASS
mgnify:CR=1 FL=1